MEKCGKVMGVCISQNRADFKKNVGKGFLQTGLGLIGDSHSGTEKEVSLLAVESIYKLSQKASFDAGPGCFAENITTEGIDLMSLPIGTRLQVGQAKLMVIQIGKDPSQPHTYHYRGHSLLPTEGVFCKVIENGQIEIDDPVKVLRD